MEYPNGHQETHWVVIRTINVSIIALSPEGRLITTKELRNGEIMTDFPAGKVDTFTPNDADLLEAAKREFREEVGYEADNWQLVSSAEQDTEWFERRFYYFAAWNTKFVGAHPGKGEQIETVLINLDEIDKLELPEYFDAPISSALKAFRDNHVIE